MSYSDNLDIDMGPGADEQPLEEQLQQFLKDYCWDAIGELAQRYPREQKHLVVDYADLYQFDADIAEDFLAVPETIKEALGVALSNIHVPNVELTGVEIRVVNIGESHIYQPIHLERESPDGYIGVRGELKKVTTPAKELTEAAYECQRCGSMTYVQQAGEDSTMPNECGGCERQGPFQIDQKQSTFTDYCKVRIETPPDESGELQSDHIDGYVRGALVWDGHEEYGLVARSGDAVTVYGEIELQQKQGRGANQRLFDTMLDVQAIEYSGEENEVDIQAHKEAFTEFAGRHDAVDLYAESLVPELYATPAWESALDLLVAYLFAAPRIDIPGGPTYRGDIHVLIMSDYGMGKSMVNSAVAMFSPKCIKESVTGMSSDVGLLAAAVEDDFGDGQWSLQPGILVRANGGHVILDEIDKTDADLERMNDALEGEQIVQVNKAGQRATYKSRMGLLATGNPKESRFDGNISVSEQLGLDQSLLSRFDGIVTMEDKADEEQDGYIAEAQGLSYLEAQEYQYGDRNELDRLDRVVSPEVGRAWIAYARENVHPLIRSEHIEEIKEWYASEVRQLNHKFGTAEAEGADMPVPVSARVVANTIRAAVAFARVGLQDEVSDQNVERAKQLQRTLIGQTFKNGSFQPEESKQPTTQSDRKKRIMDALSKSEAKTAATIAHEANVNEEIAYDELEDMADVGRVIRPKTGEYRKT